MQIIVLTNESLKAELVSQGIAEDADIIFIQNLSEFFLYPEADAYLDLLFENEASRILQLQKLLPRLVIINSVVSTLNETDPRFVRINAWNTLLLAPLIEAAASADLQPSTEKVLAKFNKQVQWVSDQPGFISARVISMIINEARISLSEGVSTREDIDTAMKLGTNYPFGPFEWAEKIGEERVSDLVRKLT